MPFSQHHLESWESLCCALNQFNTTDEISPDSEAEELCELNSSIWKPDLFSVIYSIWSLDSVFIK